MNPADNRAGTAPAGKAVTESFESSGPWITLTQVADWRRVDGRIAEVVCPDCHCGMVRLVEGVIAVHDLFGRRCVWSGVGVVVTFDGEPAE